MQKRFFVYDVGDGPGVVINPEIKETSGEWVHDEGCLSVPGLFWPITRPKVVHLVGHDIDGNDIEFEADELLARVIQHEVDHLDGTLLLSASTATSARKPCARSRPHPRPPRELGILRRGWSSWARPRWRSRRCAPSWTTATMSPWW